MSDTERNGLEEVICRGLRVLEKKPTVAMALLVGMLCGAAGLALFIYLTMLCVGWAADKVIQILKALPTGAIKAFKSVTNSITNGGHGIGKSL